MRKGTYIRYIALRKSINIVLNNNIEILDLGGFDGFISYDLKKSNNNINITVVDLDPKGLEIAKSRGLNTLKSSIIDLKSIPSESIDLILCLDAIEHIKEDEKLIHEISRVLKIKGKFFLTTPNKCGVLFPFIPKIKSLKINKKWGHLRLGYSRNELKTLLHKYNLKITKFDKYFNFFSKLAYYWLDYFKFIPKIIRNIFFKIIINLEPYIKLGSSENIIIGFKNI